MRAMITMTDRDIRHLGVNWARGSWNRRKEALLRATGAANVSSGVLHEWRDPNSLCLCAAVSFRSSAWTGRGT